MKQLQAMQVAQSGRQIFSPTANRVGNIAEHRSPRGANIPLYHKVDPKRIEELCRTLQETRAEETHAVERILREIMLQFETCLVKVGETFAKNLHGNIDKYLAFFNQVNATLAAKASQVGAKHEVYADEGGELAGLSLQSSIILGDFDEFAEESPEGRAYRAFVAGLKENESLAGVDKQILYMESEATQHLKNRASLLKSKRSIARLEELFSTAPKTFLEMLVPFLSVLDGVDLVKVTEEVRHLEKLPHLSTNMPGWSNLSSIHALNTTAKLSNVVTMPVSAQNVTSVRIDKFPEIQNAAVIETMKKHGPLKRDETILKGIPEDGPFQYSSGCIYQGQMKNGKRYGWGRQLYSDGAYYEGYWKENEPYGFGRLIRTNGDIYEGLCKEGKANGVGFYGKRSGFRYKGEWLDDQKHGQGEETWSDGTTYSGAFAANQYNGHGILKLSDGTLYEGEFKDDKFWGKGTVKYANGEIYKGDFMNNLKDGEGVYNWPDGRIYQGHFEKDSPNGFGYFKFPDGLLYRGGWLNGVQHGLGEEIIDNGEGNVTRQIGEWSLGKWVSWRRDLRELPTPS